MIFPIPVRVSARYQDLVSADHWDAVVQSFMRTYCSALGRASESLLAVCLHAGVRALPSLVKLSTVVAAQKAQTWEQLEQLPVEIELGRDFVFRSVFACPVAREQSTPENPPMILPCGCAACAAPESLHPARPRNPRRRRIARASEGVRVGTQGFFASVRDAEATRCLRAWWLLSQARALPGHDSETGKGELEVVQVPLLPGAAWAPRSAPLAR